MFRLAEEALVEQLSAGTDNQDAAGGNGLAPRRPVTARQLALIERLAEQSEMELDSLLIDVFDTDACEHLSVSEASRLIDILQAECRREAQDRNGHD